MISLPRLLWLALLSALSVVASPVYLVLGVLRCYRLLRGLRIAHSGFADCPHCGYRNSLDVLSTCRRCGVTELGSRLYCSACRQVTRSFDCGRCQATVNVL